MFSVQHPGVCCLTANFGSSIYVFSRLVGACLLLTTKRKRICQRSFEYIRTHSGCLPCIRLTLGCLTCSKHHRLVLLYKTRRHLLRCMVIMLCRPHSITRGTLAAPTLPSRPRPGPSRPAPSLAPSALCPRGTLLHRRGLACNSHNNLFPRICQDTKRLLHHNQMHRSRRQRRRPLIKGPGRCPRGRLHGLRQCQRPGPIRARDVRGL